MFTLPDILNQLQIIRSEVALLGLFITAGIILIARDWRFLILALLAQYILVGILLSRLVRPDIAVLNVLIGAFICPVLFLSARQVAVNPLSIFTFTGSQTTGRGKWVDWWQSFSFASLLNRIIAGVRHARLPNIAARGRAGSSIFMAQWRANLAPTGFSFRVFVSLLMILVTLTLSSSFPLPGLTAMVTTSVYWLVLAGLVVLTLTEEPMKAGHGLLTTLSGFGLFYITLEKSLLLIGLWGTVNLLIALAIGYLTVVKGTGPGEEI